MGILINHYKDPYQTTGVIESKRVFFVAHWLSLGQQLISFADLEGSSSHEDFPGM